MTKTIKELLDDYTECEYNKNNPILDLEKIEARQAEVISQVEALVRRETVEEILHGFPNKEFYNKIGNELNEGRHLAYDDTKEYIKHYAKTKNITL